MLLLFGMSEPSAPRSFLFQENFADDLASEQWTTEAAGATISGAAAEFDLTPSSADYYEKDDFNSNQMRFAFTLAWDSLGAGGVQAVEIKAGATTVFLMTVLPAAIRNDAFYNWTGAATHCGNYSGFSYQVATAAGTSIDVEIYYNPSTKSFYFYQDGKYLFSFVNGGAGSAAAITTLRIGKVSAAGSAGTLTVSNITVDDTSEPITAIDSKIAILLTAGQSNMVGLGGSYDPGTDNPTDDFYYVSAAAYRGEGNVVKNKNDFSTAKIPLTFLRETYPAGGYVPMFLEAGIGATGFAYADESWRDGGTGKTNLLLAAANLAIAFEESYFMGFLWHQGESDVGLLNEAQYEAELTALIADVRAQVGSVEFIAGGMSPDYTPTDYEQINSAIEDVCNTIAQGAFASALLPTPATSHGDGTHFNSPGLRTMGERYAAAFDDLRTPPTALSVVAQPSNATVDQSTDAAFTFNVSGTTPVTYQWQVSTNGGSTWANILTNAKTATYTAVAVQPSQDGYQYRCTATNPAGSITSDAATLTVNELSGLLDAVPTAAFALSIARRLKDGYSGSLIRVRRASDNAEQDIGIDGSGNLDETALTTFTGASDGFLVTIYDQSGNSRNFTQATSSRQPRIVSSGTVDKQNGKPCAVFADVSSQSLYLAAAPIDYFSFTVLSVATRSGDSGTYNFLYHIGDPVSNGYGLGRNGSNWTLLGSGIGFNDDGAVDTAQQIVIVNRNASAQWANLRRNGAGWTVSNMSAVVNAPSTKSTLGDTDNGAGNAWEGNVQEFVAWPADKTSSNSEIETNVNGFYGAF